ncbi:MAG: GNAT family N-acetyltransferase [Lachnospiraceae bacterium]|nr:GNAT family N-acetyltransferase [Lachnospiraceae bacterium]
MIPDIILEGEQVYLRSITYEDTDMIVRWRNQENVIRYFFYRGEFTRESHERWMKERVETGEVVQLIVHLKEDDRPVGCTYLRDIDRVNRKAEYGVFIGEEDCRGRGIGKEILSLNIDLAFNALKLHRLYARVREDNYPSLYSFLHCGFEKEALLRDTLFCDGKFINVVILGLLNPAELPEK